MVKTKKVIYNRNCIEYQQKTKRLLWIFGILSFLIVPALTLYLGVHGSPFEVSFSAIGNSDGLRAPFLIWTLILCAYFSSIVFAIIALTKNVRAKVMKALILISTWLLLITNLIPFVPQKLPFLASIHSDVAMLSTILLAVTLVLLTSTYKNDYPRLFHKSFITISCLFVVMIVLFVFFRAKWITEATSIIGGSVFLFFVIWWLYNENDFSAEDVLASYDVELAQQEVFRLEKRADDAHHEYEKLNVALHRAQIELQQMKKKRSRAKQSGEAV